MMPGGSIQPDLVASKLAQAENLTRPDLARQLEATPRLIELVWFIQWCSFQPGGLEKFAEELIAAFPDRFVTAAMQKAGAPRAGRYSIGQCLDVWREEWSGPSSLRNGFSDPDFDFKLECHRRGVTAPPGIENFAEFLGFYYHPDLTPQAIERGKDCDKATLLKGIEAFNWPFLKARCDQDARWYLRGYLRDLAAEPSTDFHGTKYCPDLISVLFDFMDRHAADTGGRIAQTEITRKVSDALAYSWTTRKLVRVDGNARFGKTEAVKTRCLQYPGRARLVSVPCSNSDADLVRAVADALGFADSPGASAQKLRAKVDFVLRHGRIGFVFDEAHFLWPVRYGANTVPGRLNWIRTEIADRGLPCALITTPQAFNGQSAKFKARTQYNLDQFDGRVALAFCLPDVLQKDDLFAVAKFHFPDFGAAQLQVIVGAAMASRSYLKAVEDISERSRYLANKRRAGAAVELRDVKQAAIEVIPGLAAMLAGADAPQPDCEATSAPARPRRKSAAEVLQDVMPGSRRPENFDPETGDNVPAALRLAAPNLAPD